MIRHTKNAIDVRRRRRGLLAWVRAAALGLALASGGGMLTPAAVSAADNDSDVDGRMEGYAGKKVAIEKSSTTLTFLLFLTLVVVGCVPLFKNSKRD
jgi:hypothetical protein